MEFLQNKTTIIEAVAWRNGVVDRLSSAVTEQSPVIFYGTSGLLSSGHDFFMNVFGTIWTGHIPGFLDNNERTIWTGHIPGFLDNNERTIGENVLNGFNS